MRRTSNELECTVTFKSGRGQFGKLPEESWTDLSEVETGFSLHALLQSGWDALWRRRIHVHRDALVADVVLAHANRRKPHRLPFVNRPARRKAIEFRLVRQDLEILFLRLQNLLERGKYHGKFFGGLGGSQLFLGSRLVFSFS
jgi:hypothetical protein